MKMLETVNLTVGYEKKEVVREINISVARGEILCLLGPNGSGKSTMLKSMSALLKPLKGEVYIQGERLSDIKRARLSKILAVVLTERLNIGFLSAFDVVAMGRYPHTGFLGELTEADKEKVWECIRMVNGENIASRHYNQLSDGERQKVLLARALAQEPELIILDEPTTHLDVKHKLEVMGVLKKLSREKNITVILSLHELDIALKSCDQAVFVKGGEILAWGSPEEIGSSRAISELYDIEDAGFNAFMGTVELSNRNKPSLFVVGGGGSASSIYRMLTRNNIGFYAGILHENDVDCHIAETMGIRVIREKPFELMGEGALQEAKELLKTTAAVVDTGFSLAKATEANRQLVLCALEAGKSVYSMRSQGESLKLYGKQAKNIISCGTAFELLKSCRNQ